MQPIDNWSAFGRWTFPWTSPECSVCKKTQKWTSNFCPNCGANMRCGSCEHYGWDMPQCKECGVKNNFKWYKKKESGDRV